MDHCCQSLTGDWSEDCVAALGEVAGEEAEQLPGHREPHSVLAHLALGAIMALVVV